MAVIFSSGQYRQPGGSDIIEGGLRRGRSGQDLYRRADAADIFAQELD